MGSLATEWDLYIRQVEATGIYLNEEMDRMTRVGNTFQSQIAVRDIYKHITNPLTTIEVPNQLHNIWRQELPLKLKCFIWLALHDKILTQSNLSRRGFYGPGICPICMLYSQDVSHLIHFPTNTKF